MTTTEPTLGTLLKRAVALVYLRLSYWLMRRDVERMQKTTNEMLRQTERMQDGNDDMNARLDKLEGKQ